jgi:LPS-assembly protein
MTPVPGADLTVRNRFDHRDLALRYAEVVGNAGPRLLRVSAGYIYTNNNPYTYYDTAPTGVVPGPPRNELTLGASTAFGHWRFDGSGRGDLQTDQLVSLAFGGAYEDECFIFDAHFYRRYTSFNGDHGDTAVMIQITLKTVGEFGFHAL